MPSISYGHFQKNIDSVSRLEDTYREAKKARNSRGRGAFDHITRSAIVFLISSFEVYCEDIILECCDQIICNAKDAYKLPHRVKKTINEYVKNDENHIPPIRLCDEGWRDVYRGIAQQKTDRLNTPKTKNLKDLFEQLLGVLPSEIDLIPNITNLDPIIEFRGEIAHRVKAKEYVHIEKVTEYKNDISNIVVCLDKMIRDHISKTFSVKVPWNDTYELRRSKDEDKK